MKELESLKFSNQFATLPEELYHKQNWSPFENPKLIHFNNELATDLGFPKNQNPEDLVPYINGNKTIEGSAPGICWASIRFMGASIRRRKRYFIRAIANERWLDGFAH